MTSVVITCIDSERSNRSELAELVVAGLTNDSDVRRQRQLAVNDNSEITWTFAYMILSIVWVDLSHIS